MLIRFSVTIVISLWSCGLLAQPAEPLVHEGIVDAPLERVWDAWTTTDGLKSWLAPHAEIDFRIGGAMRTNYDPNGNLGDSRTIENTVLSYEPYRMFSMRVSKAPEDFPFQDAIYAMWTVVYFDAVAPDQTEVRIVSLGFGQDEESQRMREFFDQGNALTLTQMQDRIGAAE